VVSVFDYGVVDGRPYLALEYVRGHDLAAVIAHSPRMSVDEALVMGSDAARGLHAAHSLKDAAGKSLNLVHRDVSPQNILVAHSGTAKLTDFGVAKMAGELRTATGIIKGKFEYIAPEQAGGQPIDRRADIFSLGLVLYELLVGQPAYHSTDDYELIEMARECNFVPLAKAAPRLSSLLLEVMAKALAPEPDARFATAGAMAEALEDCMGGDETTARTRIATRVQAVGVQSSDRD